MTPTTNATSNNGAIANAYSQGQNLQNQYNQQAGQTYGQYQGALSNAQSAQTNLANYTNQIAGLNYGDIYGQNLQNAQSSTGYNPQSLQNVNNVLAQQNALMAHLPQAAQQQGNYYGTTAGATANNLSAQSGNVAANQAYYNTQQQNQLGLLAATQNQANQQTTQQLSGQGQTLQGYQQTAANASAIMQNAGQTMAQIETLQQNQGYATAQQVTAYQNAYSNYENAQAALSQATAANTQANAYAQYYGMLTKQGNNANAIGNTTNLSVQPLSGNMGQLSFGQPQGASLLNPQLAGAKLQ